MKRLFLMLLVSTLTIIGAKAGVQSTPLSTGVIIVSFGEGNKTGELLFDEATQQFLSGWVSYPVPNGDGTYYMLPVNSVSGQLIESLLGEPIGDFDVRLPTPSTSSNFSHFEGTVYYGQAQEWGSLVLHSGNNGVLQAAE